MTAIKSIDINYNNQNLYVQYIKESDGELKILSVNKAPRYLPRIQELIDEIKDLVIQELENERLDRLEYIEEMKSDESRGN